MDGVDARLIDHLAEVTKPSVLELARRLGVARGTAQARLDRLRERGIVRDFAPSLDRHALGFEVLAFVSVQVTQGREAPVLDGLTAMPEVLAVHKTTGDADLLVQVVARSNEHLNAALEELIALPGVGRTTTSLALTAPVERTMVDAVALGVLDRPVSQRATRTRSRAALR
jgi:DNA-binding Lrp family transcriptional regulator